MGQNRRQTLGILVLLTAVFLMLPAAGLAQNAAGIAGTVKDTTGAVLPGVTVEASSPALIEKLRTAATDGSGQYKISDLRPGVYTVTFTLAGFTSVKREGIELTNGFTAAVNGDLAIGNLAETVTVTSASPIVDVQNVRQQSSLTAEVVDVIPSGRNWQSLSKLFPGMTASVGTSGTAADVGGMSGEANSIAIHGGHLAESKVRVNGHYWGTGGGIGASIYRVNTNMVQEFSYELDANSAETMPGGVVTNIIFKDGGNVFSGSFFGAFANSGFQGNNLDDALRQRGLTSINGLRKLYDYGVGIGGPLKRDKVWFFSSTRYWGTDVTQAGVYVAQDPRALIFTPDLNQPGFLSTWSWSNDARVTVQLSPRNKFTFTGGEQPRRSLTPGAAGTAVIVEPQSLAPQRIPRDTLWDLHWTSPVNSRLLLEVGWFRNWAWDNQVEYAGAAPDITSITDNGRGLRYGSATNYSNFVAIGNGTLATLSYVTGTHAIKGGVQWRWGSTLTTQRVSNDVNYTFVNGIPSSITQYTTPTTSEANPVIGGAFAQDQWTLRRLTVNAGLRWDYSTTSYPASDNPPVRFVGERKFDAVNNLPKWHDFDPRVGVSYDLFGQARTALKAGIGRYQIQGLPSQPGATGFGAGAGDPLATSVSNTTRSWNDANRNLIPDCVLTNLAANGECGALANQNFGKSVVTTTYDPAITSGVGKAPFEWEALAGVEQELRPGLGIDVFYYRRWFGNFFVTDNQAVTAADYQTYCISAPLDSRLPGGGGQQLCGFWDVNPAKFGKVTGLVANAKNYGQQSEVYDGLDFRFNARMPHSAFLKGGVNLGRTRTNDCYAATLPNLTVANGTQPLTTPARQDICDVHPPLNPSFKLIGSYPLPFHLAFSGTFQSNPGTEILAQSTVSNALITPSLGRNLAAGAGGSVVVELVKPGTLYGDRLNQIDLRVAGNFSAGRLRLRPALDLYNLLNTNPVLSLVTAFGNNWQRPTQILDPRLLRLSLQLDF